MSCLRRKLAELGFCLRGMKLNVATSELASIWNGLAVGPSKSRGYEIESLKLCKFDGDWKMIINFILCTCIEENYIVVKNLMECNRDKYRRRDNVNIVDSKLNGQYLWDWYIGRESTWQVEGKNRRQKTSYMQLACLTFRRPCFFLWQAT